MSKSPFVTLNINLSGPTKMIEENYCRYGGTKNSLLPSISHNTTMFDHVMWSDSMASYGWVLPSFDVV